MDLVVIALIIRVVTAVVAGLIASAKGRNVAGWVAGGFFLEIIGVIIVACLANLKEEKSFRQRAESERHRLREQLRQEQMKHEAFRQYSASRLDAHDKVLGV